MEPTAPPSRPAGAEPVDAGAKGKKGRRKWIVAGAVGILLVAVFVFSGGGSSSREATLTFVGFATVANTNVGGTKPELRVFFWFSNGAHAAEMSMGGLSWRIDGKWVDEDVEAYSIHQVVPPLTEISDLKAPRVAQLFSLQVDKTNLPMRVVVNAWEPTSRLTRIKEAAHQWFLDYVKRIPAQVDHTRHYSVTNEFQPER